MQIVANIANFVAVTILLLFSVIAFTWGLVFGVFGKPAGPNRDELARAKAVTVAAPTEVELAAHPSLLNGGRNELAKHNVGEALRLWLWAITVPVIILAALPQWITVGDTWQVSAYLAIATLVILIPWLIVSGRRRYRRFCRMREANVLPGILQTVSAEYWPESDNAFDYNVWLGCTFRTPAGALHTVRFETTAQAVFGHPKNRGWSPPEVPAMFAGCPAVGERVPVAVLYVDDGLFEVLGPQFHAVG